MEAYTKQELHDLAQYLEDLCVKKSGLIAELEAENERLREALDYARKEIANIPYPMRDVIGVLDSALCKPDEEEEDK